MISKTAINGLNAVSVSSLILTFTPVSPVAVVVALSTTTLSSISSAVLQTFELEHKIQTHNTSYLQYSDIYREYSAKLKRNHLSSDDYDDMLSELNARLGLIEDSSLPISISQNIELTYSPKS